MWWRSLCMAQRFEFSKLLTLKTIQNSSVAFKHLAEE
jgi:hypothetical protein